MIRHLGLKKERLFALGDKVDQMHNIQDKEMQNQTKTKMTKQIVQEMIKKRKDRNKISDSKDSKNTGNDHR